MKRKMNNLKNLIVLAGALLLSSCGNQPATISAIGASVLNKAIPAAAMGATRYTGQKIAAIFSQASAPKKTPSVAAPKPGKSRAEIKAKPVSIGSGREARLI